MSAAQKFAPGDTVRCIDNCSYSPWAEWYVDEHYSEDMLTVGERYLVRAVAKRDGQTGIDVGVPTPWGDQYWNANRFEKCLLRLATCAPASADTHPKGGDALAAPFMSGAVPAQPGDAQTPSPHPHPKDSTNAS
jgi:hypothetical protein